MSSTYSHQQLWERASLRAVAHMRSLWEEKGASDTRLLESFFLPDIYTVVGRSDSCPQGGRREHVIPRLVIVAECHRMIERGASDEELASFLRANVKIVVVSEEERRRMDLRGQLNLRQRMPEGWAFGDDPFARLSAAGIGWSPIVPAHSS